MCIVLLEIIETVQKDYSSQPVNLNLQSLMSIYNVLVAFLSLLISLKQEIYPYKCWDFKLAKAMRIKVR